MVRDAFHSFLFENRNNPSGPYHGWRALSSEGSGLAQWILKTALHPPRSRCGSPLCLFYGSSTGKSFSGPRFSLGEEVLSANPSKLQSIAQTHKNVVMVSAFGAHFDVYMTVAWTLQRTMVKEPGTFKCTPQRHFSSISRRWWIGTGCIKETLKTPTTYSEISRTAGMMVEST